MWSEMALSPIAFRTRVTWQGDSRHKIDVCWVIHSERSATRRCPSSLCDTVASSVNTETSRTAGHQLTSNHERTRPECVIYGSGADLLRIKNQRKVIRQEVPWWNPVGRIRKGVCIILWRNQMETFTRYWPFARGIHRSPVDSPQKGQWRELWCFLWSAPEQTVEQTRDAGDLRRHRAHYDVI